MPDYYDRLGRPMALEEWLRSFADTEGRRVALTGCYGRRVSTVWLGLDHNFLPSGPPLIFESMLFDPARSGYADLTSERYSSESEARVGHREMVRQGLHRREHVAVATLAVLAILVGWLLLAVSV